MPREIIRPSYGEPCIVQLACAPEGVQREGNYGIDFQYVLNGDRAVTWLPKEAQQAIVRSGAQEGDEICLRKTKHGSKTFWEAEKIEEEAPAPTNATRAMRQQEALAQHSREAVTLQCNIGGKPNGNGNGHKPEPAAARPEPHRPGAQVLAGALCAAIDAAAAAKKYASEKYQLELFFEAGDIRAMAATLFIEARKEAK